MPKFYFTYESDPSFPFQYGWTEVEAPDIQTAIKLFRAVHPNRPGSMCVNCAGIYTEDEFNACRKLIASAGPTCHEKITVTVMEGSA